MPEHLPLLVPFFAKWKVSYVPNPPHSLHMSSFRTSAALPHHQKAERNVRWLCNWYFTTSFNEQHHCLLFLPGQIFPKHPQRGTDLILTCCPWALNNYSLKGTSNQGETREMSLCMPKTTAVVLTPNLHLKGCPPKTGLERNLGFWKWGWVLEGRWHHIFCSGLKIKMFQFLLSRLGRLN